jgi:hypothetical protein
MIRAALILLLAAACARPAPPSPASGPARLAGLADSLVILLAEDQEGRDRLPAAFAAGDTLLVRRMMSADLARTAWLRGKVRAHGWPGRSLVGDSAAGAAWLILQHSPDTTFQREMLPLVERAAARGDVDRADVALLTDRVRLRSGMRQLYGSQFDVVDGRLVANPTEDLPGLDARRASVGLPPIAEYVRILGEMYKLPVVWPPPP